MSRIAILTGPTATGKSSLALELAERGGDIEIVNADSMLVYRGMDIGTAKPSAEERARVAHHLIDIRDPEESFTAGDFVRDVERALAEIAGRGRRALIVGGTGFYLKALLFGLWDAPKADPALRQELSARPAPELFTELEKVDRESAYRIGPADHYRLVRALELHRMTGKTPSELEAERPSKPDPRFELWVIDRLSAELMSRIRVRTKAMLDRGFIDEVSRVRERAPGSRALQAVGYAQVVAYLDAKPPGGRKIREGIGGLEDEIELATRQLVKRQRTWFKGQHEGLGFTLDRDREALVKAFDALYPSPT
ncbi:MAG TPA: tRNA (adenosine(37)-N6)-dimethylallyltransferase MiaA [Bdellovibrionota bacterium]|nr:tRNA (adenosine(37)-N6)-dimethylallyltransferase MiaA [Bdellovibrionota bacterium]